jgi:ribonuclease BN (tRNA processing enzyme)
MRTELVLLGTAGAPMPVAGRAGISAALVVDERVFVIDCGRGSPSAFADAGLDFRRLEAVFLTHLHADHAGDLPAAITAAEWVKRAGQGFSGRTTAGHDGLRRTLNRAGS